MIARRVVHRRLVGEKSPLREAVEARVDARFWRSARPWRRSIFVGAGLGGRQSIEDAGDDVRGVLYTLADDPSYLVSIQLLDGVGAGLFGALFPLVVADLTKGTGHYNLALGASGAAWGLGAALSNSVAGFIVDKAGFDAAFLFLAGAATLTLLLFWFAVPETGGRANREKTRS
jgi:MFS family permease